MTFKIFEILSVILVAVAMALSLAHALEFPGKMKLDRAAYYATQHIYYPGFTIGGGIGEAGGMIATLVLLSLMPPGSRGFGLTVVALLGLVGMQAVYWLFTHPINAFWVEGVNLDRFSSGFFSFAGGRRGRETHQQDWTALRDRWEYSHVVRAGFALVSLVALVAATSCR